MSTLVESASNICLIRETKRVKIEPEMWAGLGWGWQRPTSTRVGCKRACLLLAELKPAAAEALQRRLQGPRSISGILNRLA